MYGYNQGSYGTYASSAYSNATAAAAAAVAYSGLGQTASQQQNSVFGSSSTNPYANYNSSMAAAYGYGSQSTNAASAASAYAAQAAQVQAQAAQAAQVSRLSADAYAAAAAAVAPTPYSAFGTSQLAGYGSSQSNVSSLGYGRAASTPTNQAAKTLAALTNSSNKTLTSSSYSNYDAAVYAAASSYLQSKATGTTNMWMSKKPGANGRGGGFINKRFGNNGPPREAQQFYCEVCKISCAGQLTYKEHLEGQRHKKKEALAKGENSQSLPKSKVSFRCDLCNVTCTGQDTYNAHVRGSKHQKTLALCKKLGKPIPSTEPTIIPPSEMGGTMPPPPAQGAPIPTVGNTGTASKRVVGISTVNFVAGAKLSTTGQLDAKKQQVLHAVGTAGKPEDSTILAIKGQTEELQALIAAEQSLQPVGEEFVEAQRDATGKLLQYICKLCDCKFSDPNAKEIHLKGRRHRLQYKMKVDPNLEVEVKQPPGRRGMKFDPRCRLAGPMGMMSRGVPMTPPGIPRPAMPGGSYGIAVGGTGAMGPRGPWFGAGPVDGRRFESTDDRHVQAKHASIYPDDEQLTMIESLVTETEKSLKKVSDFFNERDGVTAKTEVIEDGAVDTPKDNDRLLKGVMRVGLLSKGLLLKGDKQVDLVVLCSHVPTVALLKEVANLIPGFFEARCVYLQSCQITLRILRDIRRRIESWKPLTDWMCELLVEKVLSSCLAPLSIGDALRRVFEALASGILLKTGPGLGDPCEKETTDVLEGLNGQQREAITASAQHALRLVAFNQLYKVLGIDRLPDVRPPLVDRKRPMEASYNGDDDVKKDKKEGEVDVPSVSVKMEI